MKSKTLEGRFINLRPITSDDAELTFNWRHSTRSKLLNDSADTVDKQKQWILSRSDTEFNFIISRKDNLAIGMLSLTDIDKINSRAQPGRFLIGNIEGSRGIPAAAEAMLLLYNFAFNRLHLNRLWGIIASENKQMIKWQIYMGMVQEGRLVDHLKIAGNYHDAIVFGLLKKRFLEVSQPRLANFIKFCQ